MGFFHHLLLINDLFYQESKTVLFDLQDATRQGANLMQMDICIFTFFLFGKQK